MREKNPSKGLRKRRGHMENYRTWQLMKRPERGKVIASGVHSVGEQDVEENIQRWKTRIEERIFAKGYF